MMEIAFLIEFLLRTLTPGLHTSHSPVMKQQGNSYNKRWKQCHTAVTNCSEQRSVRFPCQHTWNNIIARTSVEDNVTRLLQIVNNNAVFGSRVGIYGTI